MPSSNREPGDAEIRNALVEQRTKALSFLYDLMGLLNRNETTQDELAQALVERLVTAYQVREVACARLVLFGRVHTTSNYAESPWQQHSAVVVNGAIVGKLTVGYLDARPSAGEGPFLAEERSLLDQCAWHLGQAVERRQLRAALADREQLLNSIMAAFPDTICTVDRQGAIRFINNVPPGMVAEQVTGRQITEFVDPKYHRRALDAIGNVMATGEPMMNEVRSMGPTGVMTDYAVRLAPLRHGAEVDQVLMIAQDIGRQKAAQERVMDSEERYRSLFDSSMDAILLSTPDGEVSAANAAACALFGRTEAEMCEVGRAGLVDLTDPRLVPALAERAQTGHYRGVLTFVRKDGSKFQGEISSSAFVDSTGNAHTSMFLRDITEKLHAEQALAEQEAHYRQAIDATGAIAYNLDYATDRYNFISPQAERLTGYPPDELTGKLLGSLVVVSVPRGQFAGVDPERAHELAMMGNCGALWECDYLIRADANEERWLSDTSVQIRDVTGKPIGTIGILQNITERVHTEAALRASEERYRLLAEELEQRVQRRTAELQVERDFAQQVMDALGQGLAITDNQRRVVYMNPFLAELLEMAPSAMLGRSWADFLPPEELRVAQRNFLAYGLNQNYHREVQWRTASGKAISLLVSTTPNWRGGEVAGRITVFTDLTQIKEIEDDLRRSRDELRTTNAALEKAMRMKDEFLASMSHELRTPLTGILGLSEVLQLQHMGPISDKQLHAVKGIHESGQHLLGLINDILDVAKLEAAQLVLDRQDCSVSDICTASLSLVRGMAYKKEQNVEYVVEPTSLQLYADPRRVKQMLVNLLSNAIKFTPPSGRIGLRVQGDALEQVVRFVVWDEGIGIAAEHCERLFQPFVQIDSSLARHYSGTGLGLALVKRMAELHGGTIAVESAPGAGSTFTLTLPWRQTEPAAASTDVVAPLPGVATPQPRAGARILLAEDEEFAAEMLAEYLTFHGYTVDIAHDGREALFKANELLPDLILMDVRMPHLDGLQAIAQLRASTNRRLSTTPIVAVTADAMKGDAERCIAAGANAHVAKPYHLTEILAAIQTQLR